MVRRRTRDSGYTPLPTIAHTTIPHYPVVSNIHFIVVSPPTLARMLSGHIATTSYSIATASLSLATPILGSETQSHISDTVVPPVIRHSGVLVLENPETPLVFSTPVVGTCSFEGEQVLRLRN